MWGGGNGLAGKSLSLHFSAYLFTTDLFYNLGYPSKDLVTSWLRFTAIGPAFEVRLVLLYEYSLQGDFFKAFYGWKVICSFCPLKQLKDFLKQLGSVSGISGSLGSLADCTNGTIKIFLNIDSQISHYAQQMPKFSST